MNKPKFRAWDKVKQKMYNVANIDFVLEYIEIWIKSDKNNCNIEATTRDFSEVIFMQYTGLKDKNGVEIFEGDVLNYGDYKKSHEVIFKKGCFWGHAIGQKEQIGIGLFNALEDLEVIGNIHENLELLNEVEK